MEQNRNDGIRDEPRAPSLPPIAVGALALGAVAIVLALYWRFFGQCLHAWQADGSYYSHGFLIPLISAWLLWAKRKKLARIQVQPCAKGLIFVGAALAVQLFSEYIYLQTGTGLAVVLMLMGLVQLFLGTEMLRQTAVPIGFLLFAVPMSPIFTEPVSWPLRVASTKLAVAMMRGVGVVVREVEMQIVFPHFMLRVPNACSGMQSFLALVAALSMFVYIVRGPWWKKAILLVSIIPCVVLGNAVRLALTALMAAGVSQKAAEGTVHEVTGVLVFIIAIGLLLFIANTILRLSELAVGGDEDDQPSESDDETEEPVATPDDQVLEAPTVVEQVRHGLPIKPSVAAALAVLLLVGLWGTNAAAPPAPGTGAPKVLPEFDSVPMNVGEWVGRDEPLEDKLLDAMGVDTAMNRTYTGPNEEEVRMLVEVRIGGSRDQFHFPTVCLPAQDWSIFSSDTESIQPPGFDKPIDTTWLLVTKDRQMMLVRYWLWDGEEYKAAASSLVRSLNALGAWDRIKNPNPRGAMFIQYTPFKDDMTQSKASEAQMEVAEALMPSIDRVLRATIQNAAAPSEAAEPGS